MNIWHKIGGAVVSVCLLPAMILPASASIGQVNYVLDETGKSSLPQCYVAQERVETFGDQQFFSSPRNLYVDGKDNLYVADAGNNRIVKFDANLQYLRTYKAGNSLNQPSGVCFDETTGELYIADTENERVVVVNEADQILREYRKPASELLGEDLRFNPSNIRLGIQGYMYVLKGQYFMQVNQEGEFKGFVGSTKVAANLMTLLIRRFASEKQKEKLASPQPSPYLNFTMDKDGVIYAVASTSTSQIRKINMVGDNLYPEAFYGERVEDVSGKYVNPNFISVAVSDDGIISVLEENSKKIYQYAQDGTMLNVFGGEGEVAGFFTTPVSVAVDSRGALYVADATQNVIQRFERTTFASATYKAQVAYDEGRYEDAYALYNTARQLNPNYSVVNNGIAKCLYKMDRIEEAAAAYRAANNRSGYGAMQKELRRDFMKQYFGWLVLAAAVVIAAVVLLIRLLRRYADRLTRRYYHLDD